MSQHSSALVVDASVAVKWLLQDEEYATESALVLEDFAEGRVALMAPAHIQYEVATAVTVATTSRAPRLTPGVGQDAIKEFLSLGVQTVDEPDIILSAYQLVHQHRCAFYDGLYLALAQKLDAPLVVADRKFFELVRTLPTVVWIGDYPFLDRGEPD